MCRRLFYFPRVYCNLIGVMINAGHTATFIGRAKSTTTHCVNIVSGEYALITDYAAL